VSDGGSLSPAEARALRRRRRVAQRALAVFFAGAVVAMVALGYEGRFIWLAGCIPAVVVCLVLHVRGATCPRCHRPVFGRRDVDENTYHPNDPGLGPPLPERCKSCGVRLTPEGPAGGGAGTVG
jgi:hypothetical protein